ncbi:Uma2 family endonuclease [Cronbergia sp. UHCC 0137]|uniref:Uma2 family endonuclease n=1 Tax=Cronbergia sp. UHCC 0137 TaxID=3110239 RepID=UPI002B201C92|nr:Uma2 family endonuclease [Cronbergia sp. UHCC 0137]MEA5616703.1 Uma2 family endonuclease [Cronbergia sp. UHCC 0137]
MSIKSQAGVITTPKKLTFSEFLEKYPNDSICELINGKIIEMDLTRSHKNIQYALIRSFDRESERLQLDYIIGNDIKIRTSTAKGEEQGRKPDISVVNGAMWRANLADYAAFTSPIQLAVEVVSTNWEDDYEDKLDEYQRLGISEYWIVDYLAQGSRKVLGYPKVPTIFVYWLVNGVYQSKFFRDDDCIVSITFPELILTANQVFRSCETGRII